MPCGPLSNCNCGIESQQQQHQHNHQAAAACTFSCQGCAFHTPGKTEETQHAQQLLQHHLSFGFSGWEQLAGGPALYLLPLLWHDFFMYLFRWGVPQVPCQRAARKGPGKQALLPHICCLRLCYGLQLLCRQQRFQLPSLLLGHLVMKKGGASGWFVAVLHTLLQPTAVTHLVCLQPPEVHLMNVLLTVHTTMQ